MLFCDPSHTILDDVANILFECSYVVGETQEHDFELRDGTCPVKRHRRAQKSTAVTHSAVTVSNNRTTRMMLGLSVEIDL